jgi:hypothetical protein
MPQESQFEWLTQWPIVLATFIGPILAVAITLWYQQRERDYQAKFDVFSKLMKHRRMKLTQEYVGALNLVPVVFHKNTLVVSTFNDVLRILSDPNWSVPQHDPRYQTLINAFERQIDAATTRMLDAIAKELNIGLDQLTVLQGAYLPEGWNTTQRLEEQLRWATLAVFNGSRALPIEVRHLPHASEQLGAEESTNSPAADGAMGELEVHTTEGSPRPA